MPTVRNTFRRVSFVAALLVFFAGARAFAQTPIIEEPDYKPTLTFDVATIRQAPPPDANFHVAVNSPPNSSHFDATNLPMKALIQIAYGFNAPVVGMPDWANNTFFNIQARADEAEDARLAKLTPNRVRLEKRNAIRVLLTERLGLQTHMENRMSSIYNLVIAKGGVKMKEAPPLPAPADGSPRPANSMNNTQVHPSQHGLEFVGTNSGMAPIVGSLSSMLQAPVVDKTGLTGYYNYTLQFGGPWSEKDPDSYPNIYTAVQEQLGLKLEAVKENIPNLVVDHMTQPTAN